MVGNENLIVENIPSIPLNEIDKAIVVNRCYMDFFGQLVRRIDSLIVKNRQEQASVKKKIKNATDIENEPNANWKGASRVMFIPPYFKDLAGMAPQPNEEERLRRQNREYDVIVAEELKWTDSELRLLRKAVKNSLVQARLLPFVIRRDLYREKLYEGAGKAGELEIKHWKQVVASMDRRIAYVKQLDDSVILRGDYSEVDWLAIANVTFHNTRTPRQLRQKWLNEQCPQWSKKDWSYEELDRLRNYAMQPSRFSSLNWDLVADELDTDRSPFQCFSKLREIKEDISEFRPWTKEEDTQLTTVVTISQNIGTVRWKKVTAFMGGRSLKDCSLRYTRRLDGRHQRGHWTENEKLALNYAVNEYGTYNWTKIASFVGTRNLSQCREQYLHTRLVNLWKPEEDKKLLDAVKRFGEGQWARVANVLLGRSRRECKRRFRILRASTIEAKLYQINVDEIADEETLDDDTKQFLSKMPQEQKNAMEKAISGIVEKASAFDRTFSQLVHDDLQIKQEYVNDESLKLLKRYYDRSLRAVLGITPRHKYNAKLLTLRERKIIASAYGSLIDDQERKKFLQSALISIIERADEERIRAAHVRLRNESIIRKNCRFLIRTMVQEVLDTMESNQTLSPLPPFYASFEVMESLKKNIPFLRHMAKKNFERVEKDGDNDTLLLNIATKTKNDPFYRFFAAQLRRLLFVPMLMDRAIEEERIWRERSRLREIAKHRIASSLLTQQGKSTGSEDECSSMAESSEMNEFLESMRNSAGKSGGNQAVPPVVIEQQTSRQSVKRKAVLSELRSKIIKRQRLPSSEDESEISEDELQLSDEEEVDVTDEMGFDDEDDDLSNEEEEENEL